MTESGFYAYAKVELFALLSHEKGADKALEKAIRFGRFCGSDYRTCAYGTVVNKGKNNVLLADDPKYMQWALALRETIGAEVELHLNRTALESFVLYIEIGDLPENGNRLSVLLDWIAEWRKEQ